MKLTDVEVRKAKPDAKPYKLMDGGGLYLLVTATGSKLWRFVDTVVKLNSSSG